MIDFQKDKEGEDEFSLEFLSLGFTDEAYEIAMYHKIQREIANAPHTQWGKDLHALIISDRCGGRALGLCEYLITRTDLSVRIRSNAKSIREAVKSHTPDIVIFVGYQESKENYDILKAQWGQRPYLAVMYASVDFVIQTECERYGIPLMYHSMNPVTGFVGVLRDNLSAV